ncbi:4'-phosphopantetheinyl transferase family protein [Streptomyces albipurpureus]|uniref:4'-phosphopantetheinyl transferase superfamily protein n=1 Tax=Streptomyces albipurpureus TaxID=2897419 RepID=A0ABT0UH17_9ACTN|nr:4'-phosphopantetheinyl transferase superfamily protein [Streptomyces sp. CWNU-1]MCM2387919.1 4'-phosphopantetheinyl transferase superfamily protein [Streptomyces sp. CWNU-1]
MPTTSSSVAGLAADPNRPAVVDIWWWITSGSAPVDAPSVLSPAELAAAARLPRQRSQEYVVYRAAVRRTLGRLLDVPAASLVFGRRPCPECGDLEHGPPRVIHPVNPWWISISHTNGCAMLAIAPHEIGVDVERQRPIWSADLAAKVLTAAECAELSTIGDPVRRDRGFLACWTRKEATLKAVGTGIVTDLSALESHPATRGPVHLTTTVPGAPTNWQVHDLALPDPYLGSLAFPAAAGSRIRFREVTTGPDGELGR